MALDNVVRIICDSGASLTCELVTLTERHTPTELKGIASGLDIRGKGVVRYNVRDDTGQVMVPPEYHVCLHTPNEPSRLLLQQNEQHIKTDTHSILSCLGGLEGLWKKMRHPQQHFISRPKSSKLRHFSTKPCQQHSSLPRQLCLYLRTPKPRVD